MATYDNPVRMTYSILGAAVDSAGVLLTMCGPKGMQGRLVSITFVATVATTVAITKLSVGTVGDTDLYGINNVPIAAIAAVSNTTSVLTTDANPMPADTAVALATDGGSTAGDGNVYVVIDWF